MEQNFEEIKHSKISVIKAVLIVVLFSICLFLLWNEKVGRHAEVINPNPSETIEESKLVVKVINETTDYTNIDAQIPQFTNVSSAFNKKIEQYARDRITEHKAETADNWQARLETQGPDGDLPEVPTGDGDKMYLYIKFDAPEQNNKDYISILTRFGGYTGGAHGYEEVVSYNYDVKNKKEVNLSDLFPNDTDYLTKVSDASREILTERFIESFGIKLNSIDEKEKYINENINPMIYEGTDPSNPENFSNFTFNKNKVIIHFSQYQVGPYVAGLQDVEIPIALD